tara:strand:- start:803 stop:979 length:177 start_codon:yes stop_codon:yes gene_type:complete
MKFNGTFQVLKAIGGENINKVETQVDITLNIQESKALNSVQKNVLLKKLNNKIIHGYF